MSSGPRVVVVGGSLGGLSAALWLRDAGHDVTVYERSREPLEGRGAGIVLNPATVRYFTRDGAFDLDEISIKAGALRYLDPDGGLADEQRVSYRFSSYNSLYRDLLDRFGEDRYHLGAEMTGFEQEADGVTVHLASDRDESCDLLVCADGIRSTARRLLLPNVSPEYAGYVAWRGTVGEDELSSETFDALSGAITYHVMENGHTLTYPIPMVDRTPGSYRRVLNWLWYRNVEEGPDLDDLMTDRSGSRREASLGPGDVRECHVERLREDAAAILPPPIAEAVLKTDEPYLQVISDIEAPRMAFGRVALIGDSAFAARPHAAAGSAKAAEDAFKLGRAVKRSNGDVLAALKEWEPGQLALGRSVLARTREAGRRAQFEGTWRVGDPLPFGLYETGDSEMPQKISTYTFEASEI